MAKSRKQVAFDLDTGKLKEYYPNANWQNAYRVIKRWMLKNSFKWEQGSVYTSKKGLDPIEVSKILADMVDENPWLNVCMRDCVVTNIGRSHSQNYLFDKNISLKPR